MKLLPLELVSQATHGEHAHGHHRGRDEHQSQALAADGGEPIGIEWEDDMVDVNRMTTPANMRGKLIDRANGAEGAAIGS